jgi:hypothetical protein
MILDELCKVRTPLSWMFTYSFIDIINSSQLSLDANFNEVFLPLTNLCREPVNALIPSNQARNGDILLFGPRSAVCYLPNVSDDNKLMSAPRRKIRKWVRNSIELFSAQRSICNRIETAALSRIPDNLKSDYWLETIKDGILPPAINQLFSYWNYTNLHLQNVPLNKQSWRERHSELIRIIDDQHRIKKANKLSMTHLKDISKTASNAQKEVGSTLRELPKLINEFKSAFTIPKS